MAEPVLASLVTGVHRRTKGTAGGLVWDRMDELIRGRFVRDDPPMRALEQVNLVAADPQMVDAISGVLAQRIAAAAARDPEFASEVRQWMLAAARVVNEEPADVEIPARHGPPS